MTWTTHYEDQDIRVMVSDEIPDVRLFIHRVPSLPNSPWDEAYNGSRRLLELWGRAAEALTGQKADLLEACMAAAQVLGKIPELPNREGWGCSVMLQCQAAIAKAKPQKGE